MRDNIEWKLAEILAIRDAKFFKEEVNDSEFDDAKLYDDLPVQEHPIQNTNEQNKMTYLQKYLKEFKEATDNNAMNTMALFNNDREEDANMDEENAK